MGLGGVAIAVPPYVIHPKTVVLGRAGGIFVLLHNVFFFLGFYADVYSLTFTLKKLLLTALFKDVENLLVPLWFLQSLFKGLVITYLVCLIPKKWMQWAVVVAMYVYGWICCEKGMHLFYSMNRDMGIVIVIFLGYELKVLQPCKINGYFGLPLYCL